MSKDTEKLSEQGAEKAQSSEKPRSPIRSWITIGTLSASAVSIANKARKARGGADRIAQAEVVVGAASLVIAVAKTLRDLRKPKTDPDTP
jgi:hypothetical protein